jgi:hypothetical protein
MNRIKFVLWERKIALEQAKYVLKKQTFIAELEKRGKSKEEIDASVAKQFSTPVENVGRKSVNRFRLQARFKGNRKMRRAPKEVPRTFIE